MANYLGDFALESTFDTKFTTTAASTGAPTTLAGTPVISAYVGNSTTQLTAGITLTVDFDTVTGLHNVRVVATAANGYATASNYQLVITTGTVGGTSAVGYVVGEFSIEARSAIRPTVAARTLDVSATGEAGLDWANIGSPTTAQNLSATNIDVDQVVASVSGAVGSVTGAVGSVTGSVGSVTGAVGSVTAGVTVTTNNDKTGYSLTATTGLGNQTSNITGNLSGSVGSVTGAVGSVTGAVGSVTGNVGGNVVGSVGSLAAQAKTDVNTEVVDALVTDTYAEPAQGAPAATASLKDKINYIYKFLRNKITTTSTTISIYDDAGTTVDHKSTISDDATTFTRNEFGTGP